MGVGAPAHTYTIHTRTCVHTSTHDSISYTNGYTYIVVGSDVGSYYIGGITNYNHIDVMEQTTELKIGGAVINTRA